MLLVASALVLAVVPGAGASNQDSNTACSGSGVLQLCSLASITASTAFEGGTCSFLGSTKECSVSYYAQVGAQGNDPSGSATGTDTLFGRTVTCSWLGTPLTGCLTTQQLGLEGLVVFSGTCATSPDDMLQSISATFTGRGTVFNRDLGPVQDEECAP